MQLCTNPRSDPIDPEERFRLYIDESGDHVFRENKGWVLQCNIRAVLTTREFGGRKP